MNRKSKLVKLTIVGALTIVTFLGLIVNTVIGIVYPKEKLNNDYLNAFSISNNILYISKDNKVLDKSNNELFSLDSAPVEIIEENNIYYVITENRFIWKIRNGQVEASKEMIYVPTAMYMYGDTIYVGGSMTGDRNKLYAFNKGSLEYVDLTTSEVDAPRGENEIEIVYNERINCLSLDTPVIGINVYNNTLYLVGKYGGIYRYTNTLKKKAFDYNFNYCLFDNEGNIYCASDNGNVITFSNEVKQLSSKKIIDSIVSFSWCGDDFLISNRAGYIYKIDKDFNQLFKVNLKLKIVTTINNNNLFYILTTQGTSISYKIKGFERYQLCIILEIVISLIFLFLLINLILDIIKIKNEKNYDKVLDQLKVVKRRIVKGRVAYFLLFPSILLAIMFAYYPAIKGLILAFFDVEPGGVDVFCGLDNFKSLIDDTYFWSGIKNMLIFLVTDLVKGLIPAFILAELMCAMRSKKYQYISRVLLYLPGVIPGVAMLLIWESGIFGMDGLVNSVVSAFGGTPQAWMGQSSTALTSLLFFNFPWVGGYLIMYGAIINIPVSYYESAKLDGCTWFKRLYLIDLPMISPQIKYLFVTAFIGSIQDFQRVYVTTEGAHGTYIPMLEVYYNLTLFNNYGVAAAMGLILVLFLLVATFINLRVKTVDAFD